MGSSRSGCFAQKVATFSLLAATMRPASSRSAQACGSGIGADGLDVDAGGVHRGQPKIEVDQLRPDLGDLLQVHLQ